MLRRICFLYIQSLLAVHAKVARDKHDADGEAHQGPPRNLLQEKSKLVSMQERERHTKQDLVYLMPSPDYCEANRRHGSVGTRGRLCNKTNPGVGGCGLMCCGRGYQTMVRTVTESCHCRFYWCCYVECETCRRREELQLCNWPLYECIIKHIKTT